MKILWVKTDYLHPTNRGGQIRTLEMLKCLRREHEVHYVTFEDRGNKEGRARCGEYCTRAYAIPHRAPERGSAGFAWQLLEGLASPIPVAVARYASAAMKKRIGELLAGQSFDSLVCDFLASAPNIPDISKAVLFQHNVESRIWQRHAGEGGNALKRAYMAMQARRMEAYEGDVCRRAGHVVAVSEKDRETMQSMFQTSRVSSVQTGVDLDYFAPQAAEPKADLVFAGSMDWLPNIDGVEWFASEILPLIRKAKPECRVAIAGRRPSPGIEQLSRRDPGIVVTGTVPDIRPYLWGSAVSIVPLRVGGGTRLKIFEAMAAKTPVVSTTIGAEGLPVEDGREIAIADSPEDFARRCVELLESPARREQMAAAAYALVAGRFSWAAVTREFEDALRSGPRPN